jgi:hypothetical protein
MSNPRPSGTPEESEVLSYMSSESAPDDTMMADMEDLLRLDSSPTCPQCGYRGLEYDKEFSAWVHDHCGYWQEESEQTDEFDDYGGWL